MILEIRDLSCRYVSRRKDTLSHVDLSLAEGEMVLIAGRSGCGKSTLIKSITGLLEPGEARLTGTISLDGRDVTQMSAEDIGLLAGTVYQTPDDQLFAMTVADEVGFALENRGEDPSVIREEVRRAAFPYSLTKEAGVAHAGSTQLLYISVQNFGNEEEAAEITAALPEGFTALAGDGWEVDGEEVRIHWTLPADYGEQFLAVPVKCSEEAGEGVYEIPGSLRTKEGAKEERISFSAGTGEGGGG